MRTVPDIGQQIEKVVFDDGTVWDLTKGITLTGSDDDAETLNGTPAADTLTRLAENDTLNGHNGDDFAYGGLEDDYLNGGADNDFLHGNPPDTARSRALPAHAGADERPQFEAALR
jgi:Ca2+-binding RTX toxin-like protein